MALNINGTTGISGVDGSASAPALQGTDSNTGVSFGSDTVNINTGGTTRATVNSSGKFGINTTNPVGKLTVDENNASEHFQLRNTTNTSNFSAFGVDTSFNLRCYVNQSERMRIDSSGRILFNTNSYSSVGNGSVNASYIYNGSLITSRDNTGNREHAVFHNPNGDVGSINTSGSSTSYTTSSDYRLKENVTAISDGITRLKTLKPSRFNFIADAETTVDGFLAHEVTAVPEAITGTKDEVDSDNNPVYQGIDQSKLVPLLTAALQEAVAKIETLETKVAALEAG
jgi:predicted small secreted protein